VFYRNSLSSGKIICHQFKREEDWEALEEKAKALGMPSGTQVLREIARGFIEKKSSVYSGQRSFGKILSQLKKLQRSHQAYLESHEEMLKVRLQAPQEHHNQVQEQMKLLEQEIIFLIKEE
jgi:hypothetical protein